MRKESTKPEKPKNPCTKDCPNRTPTCHGTCEKNLEYFEKQQKYREHKNREAQASYMLSESHDRAACKYSRGTGHNIRLRHGHLK